MSHDIILFQFSLIYFYCPFLLEQLRLLKILKIFPSQKLLSLVDLNIFDYHLISYCNVKDFFLVVQGYEQVGMPNEHFLVCFKGF
jgi:hypothetical protein